MINQYKRLACLIRTKDFLFAALAFTIPTLIRSIPAIISWPYPIGFDTFRYALAIQDGSILSGGVPSFLHGTNLFYALAAVPYAFTHDAIAVVSASGLILVGALCLMLYLYARKALHWKDWKSLLLVIFVATYFVALRDSWDLYRQTLGFIFLMATLISMRSFNSPRRYYFAAIFMVLTVLSHELPAVILFFTLGIELLRFVRLKSWRKILPLFLSLGLAFSVFLFERYLPQTGGISLPVDSVASEPSIGLALYMGGFLVYCYLIILPLILLGVSRLKDSFLRNWAILCIAIFLLEMLVPTLPFYLWYRWILVLVYPLLFFAVEGLERLWSFSVRPKRQVKRLFLRIVVLSYVFSLFTVSAFYLSTSPENAFPYFQQFNGYSSAIPSSMVQNTLSIQDNPSILKCFTWFEQNVNKSAVIVEPYGLYDFVSVYLPKYKILPILQDSSTWSNADNVTSYNERLVLTAEEQVVSGHEAVYTIWWTNGKGWYGIPSLPPEFVQVYADGNMAVYEFGL